jgi:hypothetical protein
MTIMPGFDTVPAPEHPPNEFMAHESECRKVFLPLLEELLDKASTLMFLAASQVSASNGNVGRQ